MKRELITAMVALACFKLAVAETRQKHQCERDGIQRTVELVSADAAIVPCQVVYTKPMEDQSSTPLWNAQNDAAFCQRKYDDFIVKLESKLRWSCTQIIGPQTDKEGASQPAELIPAIETLDPVAPITDNSTPQETVPTTPSPSEKSQPKPAIAAEKSRDDSVSATKPKLLAALPDSSVDQATERNISLDIIRQTFHTGHYVASTDMPHTGDIDLCPTDGFFIWNTQKRDKPTFEMGQSVAFIFNIGQFAEAAQRSAGISFGSSQCDYNIQSSYCMDNQVVGTALISAELGKTTACSPQNGNSTAGGSLTLVSTLAENAIPEECAADAPARIMSLTSLPTSSSDSGQQGLELSIASNDRSSSQLANCRYVRGR